MARWKLQLPRILDALIAAEALQEDLVADEVSQEATSPLPTVASASHCQANHTVQRVSEKFKCMDCFQTPQLCKACILASHQSNPFHRILSWQDGYFARSTLDTLDIKAYFGHGGEPCPYWSSNYSDESKFTVTHLNGLHRVHVRWCACPGRSNKRIEQLIDHGLFPGSPDEFRMRSAYSIAALRSFHVRSSESKESGQDFVKTLVRETNNAFPDDVKVRVNVQTLLSTADIRFKDRYNEFLTAARVWKYIQSQKCSGQAFGINKHLPPAFQTSTSILCPACPHPGINMDPDIRSSKK